MALSNSQYNAIMRIYNQRQFQNKHEQEQRITEVYERLPQIHQIDDAISTQAVACAKRLLEGDLIQGEIKKTDCRFKGGKGNPVGSLWICTRLYGYAVSLQRMPGHRIYRGEKMSLL